MKNYVITIGREFASGGKEIGRMLAQKLGIAFYDSALLKENAKKHGIEDAVFDMFDEKPTKSLLFSAVMDPYAIDNAFNEGKVLEAQRKVICDAADNGPCVIVGRRADKILSDRENVVSVFIGADMQDRIENYLKKDGAVERGAKRYIERIDRERASYYNYFGDGKWGRADNYTMCFNTSKMSREEIVNIIAAYINSKD